jgi:hypothetical protein
MAAYARIELMAEYSAPPLWDRSPGGFGPIELADLPLSEELRGRLQDWADRYDALPTQNFEWLSPSHEEDFIATGIALATELRRQLGDEVEVIYRHDGPNRHRTQFDNSLPQDGNWQAEPPRGDGHRNAARRGR